ncbi:carboxypeptidase regulatory-like domain-containing protein [Acidobacterium sp. S8]|uniref:carboxypeptidase regulatory-like domain-containing protein n=1 Tax=Acidobacterium sp. S8 TaxID=1641854 RepID=UPI00131DA79D|nr:carboxypeptidase regulatory-like domain-containing protein [Acidobacterium sp. S8]
MGKKIVWTVIAVTAVVVTLLLLHVHRLKSIYVRQSIPIEGAVIQRDVDSKKELPIADVVITASDGVKTAVTRSDASGYFKVVLQKGVLSGKPVTVTFRHSSYEPLDLNVQTGRLGTQNILYVAKMVPLSTNMKTAGSSRPETVVSNVRVRYTINSRTETNVGSAVKTFQVVNEGNVPCDHQSLCSPDGKWKASSASAMLDAGADNAFGSVRASCIAGPCPFTRIDSSGFIHGGRNIHVSALNWSDTATFLMEAEVFHTAISSNVRELYPVIFGRALNFTLPPTQEGVSLEAEVNGSPMVFPLGPDLNLSWAVCNVRTGTDKEKTAVYRCELKPDYRF